MAEIIKESLLDKLLRSRYPLTNYLHRQQKFDEIFWASKVHETSVPKKCLTHLTRRRKTPHPSYPNKSDVIHPQLPEYNDERSDQDYNTAQDQSSETDDDDAKSLPKNKSQ